MGCCQPREKMEDKVCCPGCPLSLRTDAAIWPGPVIVHKVLLRAGPSR
jgi:hypothetical protein